MKRFYYLLCAVLAFVMTSVQPASAAGKQKKKSIVILYENDVHCAIGGYQAIAGLRDAVSDTAYVAVVSCGDFVQGGTAGAISRGGYVADVMRTVGYDAITLGNHEFDFPVRHTDSLLRYIGAPVVSANLYNHETNRPVYQPYLIKKFGKTKIAFIGATTPGALYTEMSAFYDGDRQIYDLREDCFYTTLQASINAARKQGAKYVVVLSHLGEDPDRTGINSHTLAEHTTGIDVILDGHTHSVIAHDTVLNAAGKPVVICETGTKFMNIGHLLIRDGRLTPSLLPFGTVSERNARVKAATDSVEWLMREKTQRVVCHSDVQLRILNDKGEQEVRKAETNLGDLVCDGYRVITGADIALANGGGIRTGKHAGDLTYGDLLSLLPYDNYIVVAEVKGSTLIKMLEKLVSFLPTPDGQFPQVSGMKFTAKVSDHSVSGVQVLNGATQHYEPINPDRTYTVATTKYCVTDGGLYNTLQGCPIVLETKKTYFDVFVEYVTDRLGGHIGQEYAKPQGRITVIK